MNCKHPSCNQPMHELTHYNGAKTYECRDIQCDFYTITLSEDNFAKLTPDDIYEMYNKSILRNREDRLEAQVE